MQEKIKNTAKDEMSKNTERIFLKRNNCELLKSELGEVDYKGEDIDELRESIKRAGMPEDVEKECLKQLQRLSKNTSRC